MYDNRALVWIFRCSVFIGLLSVVVTVIYLTPVPELQHASCQRPCHELDWPMICRVRLVLDTSTIHTASGRAGSVCAVNDTDCAVSGCGVSTGQSSRLTVLTVNGQLPGPTIQVCEKDILVVDVVNRVVGSAVAVHWRGQSQRDTPYMDGVAMVTQCPINSFTTFQYKFRATEPGTHLWQVHTGNEGLDALFGALIVRQAPKMDPHYEMYDEDDLPILVSQLPTAHGSAGETDVPLLVNGQGLNGGLARLNVTAHKRHRLRIAYAVTSLSCPVSLVVDRHSLLIIAMDGHPVRPVPVQSLQLAPGERVDAVLTADQGPGEYQMTVTTAANCATRALGAAVLQYQHDSADATPASLPRLSAQLPLKGLSTVYRDDCRHGENTGLVCLHKVESLTKLPPELRADRLDLTLYLPFDFVKPPPRSLFEDEKLVPRFNNLTLLLPSSPLLSQHSSASAVTCDAEYRPKHCVVAPGAVCECLHVIRIPLHEPVEMVLIDQGSGSDTENRSDNVFHLHGHSFHVVGSVPAVGRRGLNTVRQLDSRNQLINRNLDHPVIKDTVSVPPGGVVAIRFKANNPGFWLLRAERPSHWARGLGVILHVGDSAHLPPSPQHFPSCGSWVGPEFFLI